MSNLEGYFGKYEFALDGDNISACFSDVEESKLVGETGA